MLKEHFRAIIVLFGCGVFAKRIYYIRWLFLSVLFGFGSDPVHGLGLV